MTKLKDYRIRRALWHAWRISVAPTTREIPPHIQRMMGWL
jgi:hypothetical protein